jgi:hypothetical protein
LRAVPWPTTAICRAFASALFCFAKVEHPFTLAGRTGYRSQAQTRRCVRSLAPALSRRAVERSGGLSEQHLETRKLRSHFCYLFPFSRDAYFGITPGDKCIGKGALRFMAYIHAITAGDLQRALYAVSLLVSILLDEFLLVAWRGFGRGGLGSGRGRGLFRVFRVLFALLFTTLLGPIVLVALIAFVAYRYFTSRRGL